MTTEMIILQSMNSLGSGGVGAVITTLLFLRFYKKNDKKTNPECPLHDGVKERLKKGDEYFESLFDKMDEHTQEFGTIKGMLGTINGKVEILVNLLKKP
jgi:hypothetical protein